MDRLREFSQKLDEVINRSQSFLLLPHINADGDALGSLLAFYSVLKKKGKEGVIFSTDKIPAMYSFLPGIENITDSMPDRLFDSTILFECPNYERSPAGDNFRTKTIVNIDHHPDNECYGDLNYVDSKASSVGEIFHNIFSILNYPLDQDMAENLYVAIYTDTGGFNYCNTTGSTHRVIAEILEQFPLNLDEISRKIYRESEFRVLKLLARLIDNIKIHENGIATAVLTRDMMREQGVGGADSQNFISEIFKIKDVHTMALLREGEDGVIKVGLRSFLLPINKVAAKFGGGGHPRAAGCHLKDFDDIYLGEKAIVQAVQEMFQSEERLDIDN